MKNNLREIVGSMSSNASALSTTSARSRWMATVGVAALTVTLAACSNPSDAEVDKPTAAPATSAAPAPVESASAEPTEAAQTAAPSEEPAMQEAAFSDVNGYWCPTAPEDWEESCVDIQLPLVGEDDAEWGQTYAYPWVPGVDETVDDPRDLDDSDFDYAPGRGECWSAGVDNFPSESGSALIYCPANAQADDPSVDDPANHFAESSPEFVAGLEAEGIEIPDVRDQDRLYITQEETPFPMIRAER